MASSLVFMEISKCVSEWVSMSLSVSCAFSWALFFLFVLSCPDVLTLVLFLLLGKWEREGAWIWVGRERNWERGDCNQDLLCEEKKLFSIKGIKRNSERINKIYLKLKNKIKPIVKRQQGQCVLQRHLSSLFAGLDLILPAGLKQGGAS